MEHAETDAILDSSVAPVAKSAAADAHDARCFGLMLELVASDAHGHRQLIMLMLMMLSDFLIVSEWNMRQLMRTMLDGSVALVAESAGADAHDARCFGLMLEGEAPDADDAL